MQAQFSFEAGRDWEPPSSWPRVLAVEAHAAGEPLRVIFSGYPDLPGETILARRRYVKENLDHLRKALLWEPRGHADMYGCLIVPPTSLEADLGVIFMHNEGYSTMCGHGIIALTTVVLEMGLLQADEPETTVKIDTPAGLVTAQAQVREGRVKSVSFVNVPSFIVALDETVEVPGLGRVRYDLAFGGAFYAYVQAKELGLTLIPENLQELIAKGMAINQAVSEAHPVRHPFEKDLSFLYGTIFISSPQGKGAQSRNVCIFAEGQVDRSPTGTGLSGRLAIHHARGELGLGEPLVVESLIGTHFTGRVKGTIHYGPYEAIIPEIEGSAHITGRYEFFIDPKDPLRYGFLLR
ncbi:MAG: proline racemase family protein [Candidatus Bipolaricaulia bacterium]